MTDIQKELKEFLLSAGASDVGFAEINDGDFGSCRWGVSVVVKLSDGIIDEIDGLLPILISAITEQSMLLLTLCF